MYMISEKLCLSSFDHYYSCVLQYPSWFNYKTTINNFAKTWASRFAPDNKHYFSFWSYIIARFEITLKHLTHEIIERL